MLQIPNLVIFGQITVDDVVPASPGIWRRLLGGNALYAAAGARLVLSSDKIGIVSRIGRTTPIKVRKILDYVGIRHSISSIENDILKTWINIRLMKDHLRFLLHLNQIIFAYLHK